MVGGTRRSPIRHLQASGMEPLFAPTQQRCRVDLTSQAWNSQHGGGTRRSPIRHPQASGMEPLFATIAAEIPS